MVNGNNEWALLIGCVKRFINPGAGDENNIRQLIKKGIDWEKFLPMVFAHSVTPVVWHVLTNTFAKEVPSTVLATLESNYHKTLTRVRACMAELKNITTVLDPVPYVFFKGPSIGRYYNDNTLRHWGDLDIIIQKKDFFQVKDSLGTINFFPKLPQEELKSRLEVDYHSFPFGTKQNVELDIHWRIENDYENLDFPMAKIWPAINHQSCSGVEIPVLSPAYLILTTCIHHGIREAWYRVKYMTDFAMLIRHHPALDWPEMLLSAKKIRIKKAFLAGFLLAKHFFETKIPEAIEREIWADKAVQKAAAIIVDRISNSEELLMTKSDKVSIQFLLTDRSTRLLRFKSSLLKWRPNEKDRELLALPSYLGFVYYLVRPFRLLFHEILIKRVFRASLLNFTVKREKTKT